MIHVYQNIFGKYSYEIKDKIYVPYLDNPYYDGDFGTNRVLSAYSQMVRGEMDTDIAKTRIAFDKLFRELHKNKESKIDIVDENGEIVTVEEFFDAFLKKLNFK
jgi:hypothetical protein